MIVDGKELAKTIRARVRARVLSLPHTPTIAALVSTDTSPVTESYLHIKERTATEIGFTFRLTHEADFTHDDAALIQFPTNLSNTEIDKVLPIEKDADVLTSGARKQFEENIPGALLPPVVSAICEICLTHAITIKGKRVLVIGQGFLVGKPAATWFTHEGAVVSIATGTTSNLPQLLHEAEIIISGAGKPNIITPDLISDGVVLIDAGTSESGGALSGDADPSCAEKCALFTPVPGGVGPIAVACLFQNAVMLAENAINS